MARKQSENESEVGFSVKELYKDTKEEISKLSVKFDTLQTSIRDQERHGCAPAQEALGKVNAFTERLGKLESDSVSSRAVKDVQDKSDSNFKTSRLQWYVIVLNFLLVLATLLAPFFQHK